MRGREKSKKMLAKKNDEKKKKARAPTSPAQLCAQPPHTLNLQPPTTPNDPESKTGEKPEIDSRTHLPFLQNQFVHFRTISEPQGSTYFISSESHF
jgi:hypothetical protein